MPCIDLAPPTLPTLPAPFSITPPAVTFPGFGIGVNICCIKETFALPPIVIPLPPFPSPALLVAFLAALSAAEEVIQEWMDEYLVLSIPCPGE